MCLASHFVINESWKLNVGHRGIYNAKKKLNTFVCVEVRILLEKWIVYEGHISPRPLLQNDFLVFKYPVTFKQKIFKFSLFYLN